MYAQTDGHTCTQLFMALLVLIVYSDHCYNHTPCHVTKCF